MEANRPLLFLQLPGWQECTVTLTHPGRPCAEVSWWPCYNSQPWPFLFGLANLARGTIQCLLVYLLCSLRFRNGHKSSQNDCYISLIHTCLTPSVHHHCVALYQQAVTMWLSRGTRWQHVWRLWMVMSSGFLRKSSATITPLISKHLPVDLQLICIFIFTCSSKTWWFEMIM